MYSISQDNGGFSVVFCVFFLIFLHLRESTGKNEHSNHSNEAGKRTQR
jgi:hypothetical protein